MTLNLTDLAGTWQIDATHSDVDFTVRHMMISKVRGSFSGVSGTIVTDGTASDTKVNVEIDVASVSTKDASRDAHLRSGDFFDAEQFPKMTFTSTEVEEIKQHEKYRLHGDLTLHGVTKPVVLDTEFSGINTDPYGQTKAGASASTSIGRSDYGLTWNAALETGGVLVSDEVKIEIELQAVLQK